MLGPRQVDQAALFYEFSIECHIPADHMLRAIDRFIDLSAVRGELASFYSHTGRPSIDPELMIRMLLVGYCFGIRSERRLCDEVHLNFAYRCFCRLGLDGRVRSAADPGTLFVKTIKTTSTDAAYNTTSFYEAWRLTIQRYGIYNPYTGRGAIKGLLPHGPHNVRNVLATHILKQTSSYEQASYAIQDTADMVAKHYGRFLPQDKAALAARILNQVWEAA